MVGTISLDEMRRMAKDIFLKALTAVDPSKILKDRIRIEKDHLLVRIEENSENIFDLKAFDNIFLVGTGKASNLMAQAVEEILEGRITKGIITTKYSHLLPLKGIETIEAGHPIPDQNGYGGAKKIQNLLKETGPKDLIIFLLSGGGSALLPFPAQGIDLKEKQEATQLLLDCGADIKEINTIQKYLKLGKKGKEEETPKPGEVVFEKVYNSLIGSNILALRAAEKEAKSFGFNTLILSSSLVGETREAALFHSALVKEVVSSGNPIHRPGCLLSGGETTVTIKGDGLGGRNQEFALAGAIEINGIEKVVLLSGGTDGTDGPTDATGAMADHTTVQRAKSMGLDPKAHLENNDAYPFFQKLGDLLITGPTHTNVMDVRILLVD